MLVMALGGAAEAGSPGPPEEAVLACFPDPGGMSNT